MPMYEFRCPNCGSLMTKLCKMGETGGHLVCSCGHIGLSKRVSGFASPGVSGGSGSGSCSSGCHGNCSGCH